MNEKGDGSAHLLSFVCVIMSMRALFHYDLPSINDIDTWC